MCSGENSPITGRLLALDLAWDAESYYLLLNSGDLFQVIVDIFEGLWFSSHQWKHIENYLPQWTFLFMDLYLSLAPSH